MTTLDAAHLREALREVETDARASLAELNQLLHRKRDDRDDAPIPTLPDALQGPVHALERAGIRATLETDGAVEALPITHGQTITRVVQEASTNAIRHSGASSCRIRVRIRPDTIEVSVVDDGHGVDGSLREGHGLTGMRERVGLLDGTVTAANDTPGFAVTATFPAPTARGGT